MWKREHQSNATMNVDTPNHYCDKNLKLITQNVEECKNRIPIDSFYTIMIFSWYDQTPNQPFMNIFQRFSMASYTYMSWSSTLS